MEKYNLFLDDLRPISSVNLPRLDGYWKVARNYEEFTETILYIYNETQSLPQFISFDHDLSDAHYLCLENINYDKFEEKTGYDCAKWLIQFCIDKNLKMCKYQCHSMNPAGKTNIINLIENFRNNQQ